jgi:hypothetical protein
MDPTYTVTYNGNNNTAGSVPTDGTSYIGGVSLVYNANSAAGGTGIAPSSSGSYYTAFSTQLILDNTGSFINTNGYTFGGWNSYFICSMD